MNQAVSAKIMSLVPYRVARRKSGSRFASGGTAPQPQIAHLSQLLHWQSPLTLISEADQRVLGAHPAHGIAARQEEDDDLGSELEDAASRT
jgi:hypothetical protein